MASRWEAGDALDASRGTEKGSNNKKRDVQIVKRSSIACRRCRRLRTRCVQDNVNIPCVPCRRAGTAEAESCAFASRGDDKDRRFRIKRSMAATSNTVNATANSRSIQIPESLSPTTARRVEVFTSDIWSLLPPHEELIQGCRTFVTTCLQVGFIPKALFVEQLENDRKSVNVFLLLSILSISARFTPSLCARFGSSSHASEFFMDIAHIMIIDEMWETTLENTQAFFLLGMADWGKGDRARSSINMGIAVRMAGVLRLHKEDTYNLAEDASASEIVQVEQARRTFWVIQNHDNLYTQQHLPTSFSKSDITTLLPCSESDFAFGRLSESRAALSGTKPAKQQPSLAFLPSRSLFATLVQVHDLWGTIAREFYQVDRDSDAPDIDPWDNSSRFKQVADGLKHWEDTVPPSYRWSAWNLRGFKAEHVELAYLSIVTITKLNHIVLRRVYLQTIVSVVLSSGNVQDRAPPGFWHQTSLELFSNVWQLYEIIDTYFSTRSPDDGFPAMLAFCVYTCGSLASYLIRWPELCQELAPSATKVMERTLEVLGTLEEKWPTAAEWTSNLKKVAERPSAQTNRPQEVTSQEALLNGSQPSHSPVNSSRQRLHSISVNSTQHSSLIENDDAIASPERCRREGGAYPRDRSASNVTSPPPASNVVLAKRASYNQMSDLQILSNAATMGLTNPQRDVFYDDNSARVTATGRNVYSQSLNSAHTSQNPTFLDLHDLNTFEMLQESFDLDMGDFVHGYLHLGWGDYEQG